jgi:hypothetical protein
LFGSCDLHDADRDASVMEEVTASTGCRNVLVVTGSAAEEVAELIVLSAEPLGRVMLLEATHTSDPSLDSAMVLFKSIIQVDVRPVADVAAQR